MLRLGIDIGGSGIKGALVDTEAGCIVGERHRIPTPQPATPGAVADTVAAIVEHFDYSGPIGVGLPAVVQQGVARTAANIHADWIGTHAEALLSAATGCPCRVVNDADAAGIAEMRFGAGRDCRGVVMVVTLGTGIGSALFTDGQLLPNTELGHLMVGGVEAEHHASDAVRKREELGWRKWAARLDDVLHAYQALWWPDRFILGGGVSKKHEKFLGRLTVQSEVVPATLLNQAGIIGAATLVR
ncbi:MAG: polyphosphate glucokinase [Deltaproteobacteria bacterium]|nr:polyphosphate glucokinase [Deltaproteobacteria bacterium]HCH62864.1 polyphosphate glucokinase [Deltaproteobacteria bacterium]